MLCPRDWGWAFKRTHVKIRRQLCAISSLLIYLVNSRGFHIFASTFTYWSITLYPPSPSILDLFYKCFPSMHICIPHACWCPQILIEGVGCPGNGSYRWLWSTLWVVGNKPRSFTGVNRALNYWTTMPSPQKNTFKRMISVNLWIISQKSHLWRKSLFSSVRCWNTN